MNELNHSTSQAREREQERFILWATFRRTAALTLRAVIELGTLNFKLLNYVQRFVQNFKFLPQVLPDCILRILPLQPPSSLLLLAQKWNKKASIQGVLDITIITRKRKHKISLFQYCHICRKLLPRNICKKCVNFCQKKSGQRFEDNISFSGGCFNCGSHSFL